MCLKPSSRPDVRPVKHMEWKRPNLHHIKNHLVLAPSDTLVSTVAVIILTFTLRGISEIGVSHSEKSYTGGLYLDVSWDWREILYYSILSSVVTFALALKYFSYLLFDETRHVNNHPHEHVYARIRGVWYDFAQFDHPGGPIALNLAKDRDATALFESHHLLVPNNKLDSILAKFKVDDETAKNIQTLDPRDDGAHYVWEGFENDDFVRDAKELLVSYFLPIAKRRGITLYQATKATPEKWFMIFVLASLFVSSLRPFIDGRYWTLLVTPQLAWILVANYWHDGLHFSLASDWRINATMPYFLPLLSSPWMWYHQHVIGHHAYTNVGHKDPDIAHAPQLMREHESVRWRASHKNQSHVSHYSLVWCIAVPLGLQFLSDMKANLKLSFNNAVPYAKLSRPRLTCHLAGRLIYVFSLFIWPFLRFPVWKAVIWAIVPSICFSVSFMLNSQINHLNEDCAHASSPNFLKHQVVTAMDFGNDSLFCRYFSGGLNYQIEHHLFPFVNHCHLPSLAPRVKELCRRHGVPYNEASGYGDALERHLKHTGNMSEKPGT